MHRSVATIQNPEFINLTPLDINPLMSSCEIKVFYLGENRNRSYITKEVAKDMAKLYKEQTQIGYSKILPQLALGQSQSSILANAYFENDILDLVNVFIPPLTSNVINTEILNRGKNNSENSEDGAGRPEKEDGEKAEKTIQNIESKG